MKVLVVGGGGREHALCWAISASPLLTRLICAPGNPGIAEIAECFPVGSEDIEGQLALAKAEGVDLVVVGPEAPLTLGLADACAQAGIPCFGPKAGPARLEGSKSFFKDIANAAGAPTAAFGRFTEAAAARAYIREKGAPIVVKADGLAAGKGVVVATTVEEAEQAVTEMMEDRIHGAAGATLVIEECLVGEEISFFALCDGSHAIPLGAAQDHKRVGDGDTGPNTGGMGAYSPPPAFTEALQAEVMERCITPVLAELARRDMPFQGVLFAGLMLTKEGPKLLEFNVRFGDPECQALMLRLRSDILPALVAATQGELKDFDLRWEKLASILVVMAAEGYPGTPRKGTEIRGLEAAAQVPGVQVFHAGTARDDAGRLVANGGRVLGIGASGKTFQEAREAAYAAIAKVDWPEGFCRKDIGWRAL
ncbi:phosphoribosylamine--glycine ligase [Roseococcus sp. YIM B11640]|uniref:phosphoribosylamine--glycine ligase n=1 Tax=Roseococcus sp. YIM B11640 TaxID=3133973 RepID=UPI003C7B5077